MLRLFKQQDKVEITVPDNWYGVDFGTSAVKGIHLTKSPGGGVAVHRIMNFNLLSAELQVDKKRHILKFEDLDIQNLSHRVMQQMFEELDRREMRGALSMTDPFVIVKSVQIQGQSRGDLDSKVAYEIPNHIPEYNKSFVCYAGLNNASEDTESTVLLAGVRKDIVAARLKALLARHMFPDIFTFEFFPFLHFIRRYCPPQEQKVVVHLDFGASKTGMTFIADKLPHIYRYLPVGGNRITEEIKQLANLDLINAERVKITGAFVQNGIDIKDLETVNTLVESIERNIVSYTQMMGGGLSFRVLMSGGGSSLAGLGEYLQDRLSLDVALFNPLDYLDVRFEIDEIEQQGLVRNINAFSHVFTLAMLYETLQDPQRLLNLLDEMDVDQSFWSASRSRKSDGESDTTIQNAEKEFYRRIKNKTKIRHVEKKTRRQARAQQARTPDAVAKLRSQYIAIVALGMAMLAIYFIYIKYLPAKKSIHNYNKLIVKLDEDIKGFGEFLNKKETRDIEPPPVMFAGRLASLGNFIGDDAVIEEIRLVGLSGIPPGGEFPRQSHRKLEILCTTYNPKTPMHLQQRLNSSGLFEDEFLPFEITSWTSTEIGSNKITVKLEATMKKQFKARAVASPDGGQVDIAVFNPESDKIHAASIGIGTTPESNDIGILAPQPSPIETMAIDESKLQRDTEYYLNIRKYAESGDKDEPYNYEGTVSIPFRVEY